MGCRLKTQDSRGKRKEERGKRKEERRKKKEGKKEKRKTKNENRQLERAIITLLLSYKNNYFCSPEAKYVVKYDA